MAKPTCKICNKIKEVTFKGNGIQYPIYSCPDHGEDEKNEWEIWWEKYHDRYKEQEYWNKPADRPSCIVGYFCNEFYKFYGFSFSLDYSNPIPYKNKEFLTARKLLTMFGNDYLLIPEYIRWVFAKRVKNKKKTVTSFGFFATPDFVNAYRAAKERSKQIVRATTLPEEFILWCKENCPDVFDKQELRTYNDLNGLVVHIKCYGNNNTEGIVVNKAIELGLLNGMEQKALSE